MGKNDFKIKAIKYRPFDINGTDIWLALGESVAFTEESFFEKATYRIRIRVAEIINEDKTPKDGEICYLARVSKQYSNGRIKDIYYLKRGCEWIEEFNPTRERFPSEVDKAFALYIRRGD